MSEQPKSSNKKNKYTATALVGLAIAAGGVATSAAEKQAPVEETDKSLGVPNLNDLDREQAILDSKEGELKELIRAVKEARSLSEEKISEYSQDELFGVATRAQTVLVGMLGKSKLATATEIAKEYYKPGVIEALNDRGVVFYPLDENDAACLNPYGGQDEIVIPYLVRNSIEEEQIGVIPDGFMPTGQLAHARRG